MIDKILSKLFKINNKVYPEDFESINVSVDTNFTDKTFYKLYIGSGGNLTIINLKGKSVTFTNLPSGFILNGYGKGTVAATTTASGIIAYWDNNS